MTIAYPYVIPASGFTPTSPQSAAFLTRATTITDVTDKTRYDTLITTLVNGSYSGGGTLFDALDVLYMWLPNRTAAVKNLISANYEAVETNYTANFTAYQGYTGDGTFFLDSTFNPNSAINPKYGPNSAVLGLYVKTNITSGGNNAENMGAQNVGDAYLTTFFFGNANWTIHSSNRAIATSGSAGQWVATRTTSSAVALYLNENTTPIDSSVADTSGGNVPRTNFWFFARNNAGAPSQSQMLAGYLGAGFTSADQATVGHAINVFMTAYGLNVY